MRKYVGWVGLDGGEGGGKKFGGGGGLGGGGGGVGALFDNARF